MVSEIELVSDGDGVAIFGDPREVDLFLSTAGVPSKEVALHQTFSAALEAGAGAAQAGSQIAANSGRWVKLTEESAKALKLGKAMKGSSDGVCRAIATTSKGKVTKVLEFVKPGSVGSMLTSPAMLAGAAGIMAQLAMQQTMDEITDYLAAIDEKVDDILRAQKDAALAEMIGVGFVIDEAMTIREHTGRVSEVTWSKVQGSSQTIATTQAYALRQLDALAEKLEKKQRNVGDVAEVASAAEATVEEWLAVLARCFQLQDGLAVLELDRVLDAQPAELERHRAGLQAARRKRRDQIATTTHSLLARMDATARTANQKALLHPFKAGGVVRSSNEVAADVVVFNERIGIDTARDAIEAKRWVVAVGEAKDKALEAGEDGVDAVRGFSVKTFEGAKSASEKLSHEVVKRMPGQKPKQPDDEAEI
ncbi:hypothetical protein GCM10022240_30920 [Microbacterium kribbense]|uniref:Uncharacterized protein n=1 Tax=Microbacterium kribbense TaxID=433645 RepID=A0ABP7GZ52_9MICO